MDGSTQYTERQNRLDAQGDTHEQLRRDLKESERYVEATRRWYNQRGFLCFDYPELKHSDGSGTDFHDFALGQPIEVKHRTFNFYSLEDLTTAGIGTQGTYPTTILDTVHEIENNLKDRSSWPLLFWIWSEDFGSVCWIDPEATCRYWKKAWLYDRAKGRRRHFFLCPLFMDVDFKPIYLSEDLAHYVMKHGCYPNAFPGVMLVLRNELEARIKSRAQWIGRKTADLDALGYLDKGKLLDRMEKPQD